MGQSASSTYYLEEDGLSAEGAADLAAKERKAAAHENQATTRARRAARIVVLWGFVDVVSLVNCRPAAKPILCRDVPIRLPTAICFARAVGGRLHAA